MNGISYKRTRKMGVENLNTMKLSEVFTHLTSHTHIIISLNYFILLPSEKKFSRANQSSINCVLFVKLP